MKAVIPVAGLGTRMLPATKAIPKEMLPLVDKPLIQYIIEEAARAGITEVVLVTHSSKNAIENHFDTSFELESQLEARVKRQLLDDVRSIVPKGVTVLAVRQAQAKGLGHAIACARPVIGSEPFAVILPDVVLDEYTANQSNDNLAAMLMRYSDTNASQILVQQVPDSEVDKYGIVDTQMAEDEVFSPIRALVEKPEVEQAPSNLSIVGRYVLSGEIFEYLERTPPGAGGEIQLTDAISLMLEDGKAVEAHLMAGVSHDCGDKLGYALAFASYASKHKDIGHLFSKSYKT